MPQTEPFSCLLVDDDVGFSSMLAKIVNDEGGRPVACHRIEEAQAQISRRTFDLVILDNRLPDGTGYEFYPQVARRNPGGVVVMITGAPELSHAVEMTRNGLFDYLTKPLDGTEFANLLRRVKVRLRRPALESGTDELLGESPAMQAVRSQLHQAAKHANATVLILGETGTGKDLVARFLHRLSFGGRPSSTPYVALNCANVPADIFEAELFGNEKGAYTGADRRRTGLADAAQGGTLFLDEVAEIPLGLQPKLLRFLENNEYRPLGGNSLCRFQGRVVAATNRVLTEEVRAGRFREDLMYRLDVFRIQVPPLREHLADLDLLSNGLLSQLCEKYQRPRPAFKAVDLQALHKHTFPGNVRELRNLLERSLLRTEVGSPELLMDLEWLRGGGISGAGPSATEPSATPSPVSRTLSAVEQQEYELIAKTLASENGGIRRTAARLGLTHQALLRRLQKWPELRQAAGCSE